MVSEAPIPVQNGVLARVAQNALLSLTGRLATIGLLGFVLWYGKTHLAEVDQLAKNTVELAKIVAVLQSEGGDRDRRLDRVEGAIDRLVVRPR